MGKKGETLLKSKRRLLPGIIIVTLIAVSLITIFFLIKEHRSNSSKQPDQNVSTLPEDESPGIDYSKLNLVLEKVPEYYTFLLDKTEADHLSEQLEYIKVNKKAMTQELVDQYAAEIQSLVQEVGVFQDIPQIYLKTEALGTIHREYSDVSVAVADSTTGVSKAVIDMTAQIKLRGNSTMEVAKKSYTLKLSQKADVLGMGKAKKWVLNANAFDKTLLRNKLVFDFASTIGLKYTPASAFADVWLNGTYLGNYLISELVEVSPSRVDIEEDKGDYLIELEDERITPGMTYFNTPIYGYRFGVTEPEDITDEQLQELKGFLEKVETAIDARDWSLLTTYVDEKSYIDFYILSEVFKVVDFDYSSTRFYIKDNKLYAGPPWDYDLSSGNADKDFYYDYNYPPGVGEDSSSGLWCIGNLYSYCYEFPEFREALSKRYLELSDTIANLYEDNSLGTNQIDLLMEKYKPSFDRNFTLAGWTFTQDFILERIPEADYLQNVQYLRDWLKKRNEFLKNSWTR